jgi:thioredoxin-dependent peroxiredoxin
MKASMSKFLFSLLCLMPMSLFGNQPIEVGQPAPTASVIIESGETLQLADLYKQGPVLIYFYPRASTSGCTTQACNIRDNYEAVQAAGITVLGVSTDGIDALQKFRSDESLPFNLVSDSNRILGNAFGVGTFMGLGYKRQTFLVMDGKIAWRDLSARPSSQSQDALEAWKSLSE